MLGFLNNLNNLQAGKVDFFSWIDFLLWFLGGSPGGFLLNLYYITKSPGSQGRKSVHEKKYLLTWKLGFRYVRKKEIKKFLNLFCTLGLLPCLTLPLHKAKWVQLNGKILQVLKTSFKSVLEFPQISRRFFSSDRR